MNNITQSAEDILKRINKATAKLIFITNNDHQLERKVVKQIAEKGCFSYKNFQDMISSFSCEGKITDFPTIKEQIAAWVYGISFEEQTNGIVVDQFDMSVISQFNLKIKVVQELKNFSSSKKVSKKLILINFGDELEETFEKDLIKKAYVIRL